MTNQIESKIIQLEKKLKELDKENLILRQIFAIVIEVLSSGDNSWWYESEIMNRLRNKKIYTPDGYVITYDPFNDYKIPTIQRVDKFLKKIFKEKEKNHDKTNSYNK